jgi:hypothetical protein
LNIDRELTAFDRFIGGFAGSPRWSPLGKTLN